MSRLHVETPLQRSAPLSDLLNHEVLLKLENIQPSGSFKLRGMGYHCQKELERGCKHLISASGGNAGLAVTLSGKLLNTPVTVFVPSSTPQLVRERIVQLGGHVTVHGDNFGQANDRAVEESKKPGCSYIHPYLHPETCTMIDEMAIQLEGRRPGCLLVSVGGGGLLRGLLVGLERHGWLQVPVIALETHGADCMHQAVKAGKVVELPAITSIAVTLGAKAVFPDLLEVLPKFNVHNRVITDAQALEACLRFAECVMDADYGP
ncbi:hypothetical protein B566_EDAN005540 [Ephemera danica]|nr:hypothetical protein B566_EDAN005540 [Ephemera danica]